jgi:hypothetical protein
MKYEFYQKLQYSILGILLITWLAYYIGEKINEYHEKRLSLKEGLELDPNKNGIADKFNKFGKDMDKGFNKLGNDIGDFFKKMGKFFNGINTLSQGIDYHFKCGISATNKGYARGLRILGVQFECACLSIKRFFNGSCTFYYIMDIIFGVLYLLFIQIPIFIIKVLTTVDLQFIVDLIKAIVIDPLDAITSSTMGFSITRWSDSVQKKCYLCAGDLGQGVEWKTFEQWSEYYKCTTSMINKGTNVIVKSVFGIDNHWKHWFWDENNYKSNWEDWPEFKSPPPTTPGPSSVKPETGGAPL